MTSITVIHGAKKYAITFPEDSDPTSEALSLEIETLTGIPPSQQKLIHKGRQLTISDITFVELDVKKGSKIMLLGRQPNPASDEMNKKLGKVKTDAECIKNKVNDLNEQLNGINNGYLSDDLKPEALSMIHKQSVGCVEQSMKLLEHLDSLQSFDESVRSKKKSNVLFIQSILDECDELMERL